MGRSAIAVTVPLRAALYLRVTTARQAEHDVSIPDQKRQGEAYCGSRGYQLVATYVEPGASSTSDRRPGTSKPAPSASDAGRGRGPKAGYARRSQFCSELAEGVSAELRSNLNS
jgi:hypothetical protein